MRYDEKIDWELGQALQLCWFTIRNHREELEKNTALKDKHLFDKFYNSTSPDGNGWPLYLSIKANYLEYSEKKVILDDCKKWLNIVGVEIPKVPSAWHQELQPEKDIIDQGISRGEALVGGSVKYGTKGRKYDANNVITGESTTMDCIALVSYMYQTPDKWVASNSGSYSFYENPYFEKVDKGSLRRGDVIVWDYIQGGAKYGHIVVYLGNDKIIESTKWGIKGVRYNGVRESSLSHYYSYFFDGRNATLLATGYYRLKDINEEIFVEKENYFVNYFDSGDSSSAK